MEDPVATTPSVDDRNLAMLAHLLGMVTGFIGALVIWLLKREQSPFVDEQGKEALNFQLTMLIAVIGAWMLMFVLIGFFLLPLLLLANFVFCILAAVAVSNGKPYRYPVALRLLK